MLASYNPMRHFLPLVMLKRRKLLAPILYLALILLAVAGICLGAFNASESMSLAELQSGADQRLELYAAGMNSELTRYARLPDILGLLPAVSGLMHNQNDRALREQANHYLELLTNHTGARAIYILNRSGRVIATSNWQSPDSYLGESDAFRPYYQEAIHGRPSRFFGIGT
jgi:C4-dicarboxylate-specific signal transduction histidine kinase